MCRAGRLNSRLTAAGRFRAKSASSASLCLSVSLGQGAWPTNSAGSAEQRRETCPQLPPNPCAGVWRVEPRSLAVGAGGLSGRFEVPHGEGGCPMLEVQSLVIYSSTWALGPGPINPSPPPRPAQGEEGRRKGVRRGRSR